MSVSTLGISPWPLSVSFLCAFLGPVPWFPGPLLNSLVCEPGGKSKRSYSWLITSDWSPKAPGWREGWGRGEKAEAALWELSLTAWQNLLHLFDGHSHSSSESHHFPPPRISSRAAGMGLPSNRKQGGFSLQRTHNRSPNHCLQQTRPETLIEDWAKWKECIERKMPGSLQGAN